uniref:Uncharacterized protein n=1 Tax=Arundo donax TaxID=35708 RepID=A0A0A9AQU9_ARUDO
MAKIVLARRKIFCLVVYTTVLSSTWTLLILVNVNYHLLSLEFLFGKIISLQHTPSFTRNLMVNMA